MAEAAEAGGGRKCGARGSWPDEARAEGMQPTERAGLTAAAAASRHARMTTGSLEMLTGVGFRLGSCAGGRPSGAC